MKNNTNIEKELKIFIPLTRFYDIDRLCFFLLTKIKIIFYEFSKEFCRNPPKIFIES
jgi:hypothetical protein